MALRRSASASHDLRGDAPGTFTQCSLHAADARYASNQLTCALTTRHPSGILTHV